MTLARMATIDSSGTMAKSSSNRIDTARWPAGLPRSPRSSRVCMITAVELSTKPIAPMKATGADTPAAMATRVNSRPQVITWAAPSPKISRLKLHSRCGRISRPMMNRKMTTPNSATCRMVSGSRNSFRPNGPMARPAAR